MDDILKVFFGAFNVVLHNKTALFKALLIPFILLVIVDFSTFNFETHIVGSILLLFVNFILHTMIAVTTHRIILLGKESVPEWGRFFSMRDLRFILYSVGLVILMIPIALISSLVPSAGGLIGMLIIIYLSSRLSLVFPSIAIEENWNFQESWANTKDYQLMMLVTVVVFPIIIGIPEYLLAYLPYSEIPTTILSILTTIFVVSALSVAFTIIHGEVEPEEKDEYHPIPDIHSNNPYA